MPLAIEGRDSSVIRRTNREQAGGAVSELSERTRSPWTLGVAVFAAAMLMVSGVSQFLLGIAALIGGEVFVRVAGYIFSFDTTVWGWIHLLIGVVLALVGFFLFRGSSWAIWAAIGLAALNAVLNFMWLPTYPVWAVVLIALDIAVVWALATIAQPTSRS